MADDKWKCPHGQEQHCIVCEHQRAAEARAMEPWEQHIRSLAAEAKALQEQPLRDEIARLEAQVAQMALAREAMAKGVREIKQRAVAWCEDDEAGYCEAIDMATAIIGDCDFLLSSPGAPQEGQ